MTLLETTFLILFIFSSAAAFGFFVSMNAERLEHSLTEILSQKSRENVELARENARLRGIVNQYAPWRLKKRDAKGRFV